MKLLAIARGAYDGSLISDSNLAGLETYPNVKGNSWQPYDRTLFRRLTQRMYALATCLGVLGRTSPPMGEALAGDPAQGKQRHHRGTSGR